MPLDILHIPEQNRLADIAPLPDLVSRLRCDHRGRTAGARSGSFEKPMLRRLLVETVGNTPNARRKQMVRKVRGLAVAERSSVTKSWQRADMDGIH